MILFKVEKWKQCFDDFSIQQIPREQNEMTDALAKNAAQEEEGNTFRKMPILELNAPSWNERLDFKINEGEALSVQQVRTD